MLDDFPEDQNSVKFSLSSKILAIYFWKIYLKYEGRYIFVTVTILVSVML